MPELAKQVSPRVMARSPGWYNGAIRTEGATFELKSPDDFASWMVPVNFTPKAQEIAPEVETVTVTKAEMVAKEQELATAKAESEALSGSVKAATDANAKAEDEKAALVKENEALKAELAKAQKAAAASTKAAKPQAKPAPEAKTE